MNVTFGIMDPLNERIRKKTERYGRIAEQALKIVKEQIAIAKL
jgi:folate-dependent tRNA-U54 methylase TrmFO/GidA